MNSDAEYDLMMKGASNVAKVMPSTFEGAVKSKIEESGGLLTKEAAAHLVLRDYGLHADHQFMHCAGAWIFTFVVSRNNQEVR